MFLAAQSHRDPAVWQQTQGLRLLCKRQLAQLTQFQLRYMPACGPQLTVAVSRERPLMQARQQRATAWSAAHLQVQGAQTQNEAGRESLESEGWSECRTPSSSRH